MYHFESRIRYSESNSEGRLTMASLLNYFQDCSTFHSEDLGLGITYLKEQHLVWVLSSWQIVVKRFPELCERVEIGTFPYEFKGFLGYRNFFLRSQKGEYDAMANTLWSLLSTDTMKPVPLPKAMQEGYTLEEKLPMEYAPRKITILQGGIEKEPIVVKKHHLDTNHHVNNGQYVSMAMELLPEDFKVTQLRAEYKKQAWLDDILYPYVVQQENRYSISLRDQKGSPYVNVEFAG